MKGFDEFLEVFGAFSVGELAILIVACVFLYGVYKKASEYFHKKWEAESARDAEIKQVIEATNKYPEYRAQSIKIQHELQSEIQAVKDEMLAIKNAIEEHTRQLEQMRSDNEDRERSKLRDRLLQSFRYYTSLEKNPMQAWTRMESEAFWELFKEYERAKGNGYMHTDVKPAMLSLTIVEMTDTDGVTTLMHSRK